MNSHDRRKASRRRHMLLPLGKPITIGPLIGREVYIWHPLHRRYRLDADVMRGVVNATVSRHIFGKSKPGTGEATAIVIDLHHANGSTVAIKTNANRLRLKNPADRAPRPWWVALSLKRKESRP